MRRLLAIYGLVCALALGASGHLLPAEVCAHAAAATTITMQADDCCHAQVGQHDNHHATAQHAHTLAPVAPCCHGQLAASIEAADQFDTACTHCLSRSVPTPLLIGVRTAQTMKRTVDEPALLVRQLAAPAPLRASVITPPQHAPPLNGRRHLLLSTLLI